MDDQRVLKDFPFRDEQVVFVVEAARFIGYPFAKPLFLGVVVVGIVISSECFFFLPFDTIVIIVVVTI